MRGVCTVYEKNTILSVTGAVAGDKKAYTLKEREVAKVQFLFHDSIERVGTGMLMKSSRDMNPGTIISFYLKDAKIWTNKVPIPFAVNKGKNELPDV